MNYFIKTFGCQMNEHDSQMIGGVLNASGYKQTEVFSEADVVIANTCCIRESAENKIWGFIGNLKSYKETIHQENLKNGTAKKLIFVVCGCMTQQEGVLETIRRRCGHIDIVVGTYQQHKLAQYLSNILAGSKQIIDVTEDSSDLPDTLPINRTNNFQAQLNIIYGCNNFCTYCIVPYVRGRERSRSFDSIVAEAQDLGAKGCKELTLLGQNVNSYGKDWGGNPDFAKLLIALNQVKGIERIRYMSPHPRDFSLALVDTIKKLDKVCHHFHLPLQAGFDTTLKNMNRGYTTAEYQRLVGYIRQAMPDAAITTDLIVGFPGETEEAFTAGLAFIKNCRFDTAYTFLYSKRSGTAAATRDGQVSEAVKKERLLKLIEAQNPISLQINHNLIGKEIKILVEGVSKTSVNTYTGRSDTNKIVIFEGNQSLIGTFVDVRINKAKTWHLEGELVAEIPC